MTRAYMTTRPEIRRLRGQIFYPHDIRPEPSIDNAIGPGQAGFSFVPLWLPDRRQPIGDYKRFTERHYREIRAQLYPPANEQLDLMFHDPAAWRAAVEAIKTAVPKPAAVEAAAMETRSERS